MGQGLKRARAAARATRKKAAPSHQSADELAQQIKDVVNGILFDKRIPRSVVIEAFEEAGGDIDGILESLRDDERRKQERA